MKNWKWSREEVPPSSKNAFLTALPALCFPTLSEHLTSAYLSVELYIHYEVYIHYIEREIRTMEKITKEELMKRLELTEEDLLNIVGGKGDNDCQKACTDELYNCTRGCSGTDAGACWDECTKLYYYDCKLMCPGH